MWCTRWKKCGAHGAVSSNAAAARLLHSFYVYRTYIRTYACNCDRTLLGGYWAGFYLLYNYVLHVVLDLAIGHRTYV